MVKFRGVRIADEETVNYEGESGGVGVMAEEHGGGIFERSSRVERGGGQGGAGIRAPIGEDQGQFLKHHRIGRICRGSDGGMEGDQVL